MPDFQNLFDTLSRSAFLNGHAVKGALQSIDLSLRQEIEQKFNALAGEDTRINSVLTMLQKITDAEPGSPEWDEGQNLYTLISNKYVALANKTDSNEIGINDLRTLAEGMATDLAAYNQAITAKVDKEIVDRKAAVTDLQDQLDQTKSDLAAANNVRTAALAQLNEALAQESNARGEKDDQLQAEINTLRNRLGTAETKVTTLESSVATINETLGSANVVIDSLKLKQQDLLARVEALEGFFVNLGDGTELANEFARGLAGQPSAYGHSAV